MFVCPLPKISQVMMKRRAELHISVDLLCGITATELLIIIINNLILILRAFHEIIKRALHDFYL